MGGHQSSRRITIENEDMSNVIKVSEKVVERLKGSAEENSKSASTPAPPPRSYNTVQIRPQKIPLPVESNTTVYNIGTHATTTAIDVRRLYEEELRETNEYWQERMKDVERSHERINRIWQHEYKKAIEEAESNPMLPLTNQETVPCCDKKSVVINCYKKNRNKPLLCANEVQAFSKCVNSARMSKNVRV